MTKQQFLKTGKGVVLNLGQFCAPGHIWQCLEARLVVTAVGLLLALSGGKAGCCDAPQGTAQAYNTGASGPRLRNPLPEGRDSHFSWALLFAGKKWD